MLQIYYLVDLKTTIGQKFNLLFSLHLEEWSTIIRITLAKGENLKTLMIVLLVFGHISRLKINFDKSTLSSINIGQDQITRMALLLDCKALDWPLHHLGLSLRGNPRMCFLGSGDCENFVKIRWVGKNLLSLDGTCPIQVFVPYSQLFPLPFQN